MSDAAAALILSEPLAGLQAQAIGLAEAARLPHELRALTPRPPWKWVAAKLWPRPLTAVADSLRGPLPGLVIACGGMGAAVAAALRRGGRAVVQVQHPRLDPRRFDLVVVNRHDGLTGPNVVVTRTALHRASPERLAAAAAAWHDRFAHLPRPLVAALIGGSNGRYRLDAAVADAACRHLGRNDAARPGGVGRHAFPSHRPRSGAGAAPDAGAAGRLDLGRQRGQSLFRHAGPGGRDRRDAGQRVDDFRGRGDGRAGDDRSPPGPLPPPGTLP